jgi:hypothetical protein
MGASRAPLSMFFIHFFGSSTYYYLQVNYVYYGTPGRTGARDVVSRAPNAYVFSTATTTHTMTTMTGTRNGLFSFSIALLTYFYSYFRF